MPVAVTVATAADVDAIAEIAGATVDWHHAQIPYEIAAKNLDAVRTSIAEFLAAPRCFVLLARDRQDVLGFVQFMIVRRSATTMFAAHRFGFIEHIAVRADRKRQGIGHTLLEAVRDRLRRESIADLRANVFETNAASAAFFEKEGFGTFSRIWSSQVPAG